MNLENSPYVAALHKTTDLDKIEPHIDEVTGRNIVRYNHP